MKIVVINPNSSTAMTQDIEEAALAYANGRFEVTVLSTPNAPEFINTLEDKVRAASGMSDIVRRYNCEADAFVIACACDPNLKLMREITSKPVIGIGEASMQIASILGNSFSILQTDTYSVPNKIHLVREYHMDSHLASVCVADGVETDCFHQYLTAARRAIAEDNAEVIILGCAGLCGMTEKLSQELGVPVLDGVACGLAIAEGLVNLGVETSKIRYYSGGMNG